MYTRILTGTIEKDKAQRVFAAFFTRYSTPFLCDMRLSIEKRTKYIPMVMMQLRPDGTLGFSGGKVDFGETLVGALVREIWEELGISEANSNFRPELLTPMSTFSTEDVNIHCFSYEIPSLRDLKEMFNKSFTVEHFEIESCGSVLVQINSEGDGYNTFLKNQFCATARDELRILVQEQSLLKLGEVDSRTINGSTRIIKTTINAHFSRTYTCPIGEFYTTTEPSREHIRAYIETELKMQLTTKGADGGLFFYAGELHITYSFASIIVAKIDD